MAQMNRNFFFREKEPAIFFRQDAAIFNIQDFEVIRRPVDYFGRRRHLKNVFVRARDNSAQDRLTPSSAQKNHFHAPGSILNCYRLD